MRTSVITGLFACALVFFVTNAQAEAASIDLTAINSTKPAVVQLLDAGDGLTIENQLTETEVTAVAEVAPVVVQHTVVEDETLSNIADQYSTTWKRIYDKNETLENPDVINPGEAIIIPSPEEEVAPRELPTIVVPEVVKPQASTKPASAAKTGSVSTVSQGSSSGNLYSAGYCTWYVKNRRPDLPNNLGNAYTWVSRAAAQGLSTGSTPVVGAVGQQGNHVVYVESVNGDGTVTISEMNFNGWNVISSRTVSASNFQYIY